MQTILKYDEYINIGGIADSNSFNILSYKAVKKLEKITNNRIYNIPEITLEIKVFLTELINYYFVTKADTDNITNGISSYSNGIESISYIDNNTRVKNDSAKIKQLALDYLPANLIYRGRKNI